MFTETFVFLPKPAQNWVLEKASTWNRFQRKQCFLKACIGKYILHGVFHWQVRTVDNKWNQVRCWCDDMAEQFFVLHYVNFFFHFQVVCYYWLYAISNGKIRVQHPNPEVGKQFISVTFFSPLHVNTQLSVIHLGSRTLISGSITSLLSWPTFFVLLGGVATNFKVTKRYD